MKISFIIPVYNCKAYLPACVDSIRAVGMEDYEILLIDDGSTDGGGEVCDALAARFPEIRVVHQSNAGASAARNRGIQEAAGDLLLFIDADDSIDSAALRAVLSDPRCAENDLTIFGLTFDYYHHGECYRRDPLYFEFDGVMDQQTWGNSFVPLFRSNTLSSMCTKVFKREILQSEGLLLDTSLFLYEDLEFVLRYLRHCNAVWNVPQAIYHYRQGNEWSKAKHRLNRIDSVSDYLKIIEAALETLPDNVSETDRAAVLQLLYIILARVKITGAGIREIRAVCGDFRLWAQVRCLPLELDLFQRRLMEEKVAALYIAVRKAQLRHWVAVRVKAVGRKLKAVKAK